MQGVRHAEYVHPRIADRQQCRTLYKSTVERGNYKWRDILEWADCLCFCLPAILKKKHDFHNSSTTESSKSKTENQMQLGGKCSVLFMCCNDPPRKDDYDGRNNIPDGFTVLRWKEETENSCTKPDNTSSWARILCNKPMRTCWISWWFQSFRKSCSVKVLMSLY